MREPHGRAQARHGARHGARGGAAAACVMPLVLSWHLVIRREHATLVAGLHGRLQPHQAHDGVPILGRWHGRSLLAAALTLAAAAAAADDRPIRRVRPRRRERAQRCGLDRSEEVHRVRGGLQRRVVEQGRHRELGLPWQARLGEVDRVAGERPAGG